ncbi:ABC transporter substrate-binding protein [Persicimonas caeni]|jgi:phospholipid transport system substrate-binding protein|uniref:ABC transporter substrate-binding protein n=1 Tax=Persicimonas caeni TaxID=2292766 RepID=A0A4Y6Q1H8_PERCE|nr:ABC transporter substrate-binding protein [Persicimonas caeni]QDG54438.1 ABC transporter substrate-binding protein [Persicimonas caeni]QED35659.1 ABC transporter substrate-binding protein [Persicimonas caeni]
MYRKFRKTLSTGVLAAAFILGAASPALAGPPTDFVKENAQEVGKLLQQKDSKERYAKFSKKVNEIIDYRELASRALGEHWKKRTPEEQEKFLSLLREMIEANYEGRLAGNTMGEDYEIKYLEEKTRGNLAIVKTSVKWDEGEKPVDYKLVKKDGGWVVYDIVADDISTLESYRDAYTDVIESDGWDKLISLMEKKVEELRAQKK